MSKQELSGRTALVTGASSGLGVDFARELAARGADLVIVARRGDALDALKAEIEAAHKVSVRVDVMDLSTPEAAQSLYDRLSGDGVEVDLLVNNAGFGMFGKFLDLPLERTEQMLRLNVVTLTSLTWLFGNDMVRRGWGRIMQVASTGAYQATPTYAAYSGTKGYVLLLGEALNHELKGTGVTCTVFSPGPTTTEFADTAGHARTPYMRLVDMTSDAVARQGIRAMLRGKDSAIAGFHNVATIFGARLSARKMNTWLAGRFMRTKAGPGANAAAPPS
jgi:short-subunit dehydrogenase